MKNPPVAAKIHKLTSATSDEITIPKTKPMKQEQAERKLASNAFLTVIPADNNTAKSPKVNKESSGSIRDHFKLDFLPLFVVVKIQDRPTPLPQDSQTQSFSNTLNTIILLIPFSFIPSFPTSTNEAKCKFLKLYSVELLLPAPFP